jgi:hypothetical protein
MENGGLQGKWKSEEHRWSRNALIIAAEVQMPMPNGKGVEEVWGKQVAAFTGLPLQWASNNHVKTIPKRKDGHIMRE